MRLLANPLVIRAAVVLFCASFAFVLGLVLMRALRRRLNEEADISSETAPTLEKLPLHLYNTVIQQLKQQKHELQVQTQAEQRRARTTENFSQAVLANLSCGVLVFSPNGLVKQFNPAAKEILGFSSPSGMSAEDIFRDVSFADEVRSVLHEGSGCRRVESAYTTPTGNKRHISVIVSPVAGVDGSLLGAACLINDLSDFESMRRQHELHGELSAEMALELRTSLTTISGYAQQLAGNHDPEFARQLASDIAAEAARLDRTIGGFLTEKRPLKTTAAQAGSANRG